MAFGRAWRKSAFEFVRHLIQKVLRDDLTGSAAQVSYYVLFSLFPLLFFLVTLTAFIPPLKQSIHSAIERASSIMPAQAMSIIRDQVHALTNRPKPKLLTLGLVVAIYSASWGVDAFRKGLNNAWDVVERRSFWRCHLLAIFMTVVGAIAILVAFALMLLGGRLGYWIFDKFEVGTQFVAVWSWLRFPIIALLLMILSAFAYFILPDVDRKFRLLSPGTVVSTVCWVAATWGFTFYSDHFGQYNVTYGSLGGVIILLTWFYISALVYLLGAELDVLLRPPPPSDAPPGGRADAPGTRAAKGSH